MKYSQLHRFFLIDSILYLNTEGISTKDMLERINESLIKEDLSPISLRQLQNDLIDMKESLDAPIDNGKGQRKIRYDDISFCVFNRTREPYKIEEADNPLTGRMNWLRFQMDYMKESFYNDLLLEVIDYDDNLQLANINELPTILQAIIKGRVIKIGYATKFSSEIKQRIVHPYFLHQYNNRWYLFALYRGKDNTKPGEKPDTGKDGIRCYALDRICGINQVNERHIIYESKTVQEIRNYKTKYFSHIVGIMNKECGDIVDMDLIFNFDDKNNDVSEENRLFYNLLKSNPFYHNFKFKDYDGGGCASAKILPNPELENHLMMFAHTAYISNENIRNSVVQRAKQILATQHSPRQIK